MIHGVTLEKSKANRRLIELHHNELMGKYIRIQDYESGEVWHIHEQPNLDELYETLTKGD